MSRLRSSVLARTQEGHWPPSRDRGRGLHSPLRRSRKASWQSLQDRTLSIVPRGSAEAAFDSFRLGDFFNRGCSRRLEPCPRALRRHVVERCIYGVDINPLAVELARVSLWVETLDPELPFSFLDHKIKVGNSLVGCWLDRVEDYPLKAWEREGGDGKDGPRTQRIEEFLKGEKNGKEGPAMAASRRKCGRLSKAGSGPGQRFLDDQDTTPEEVVGRGSQRIRAVARSADRRP